MPFAYKSKPNNNVGFSDGEKAVMIESVVPPQHFQEVCVYLMLTRGAYKFRNSGTTSPFARGFSLGRIRDVYAQFVNGEPLTK